jgi:chromosome segregation ATPase
VQSVSLRKRLFGYAPAKVHELIKDRDHLLAIARERIKVTEAEMERVKVELGTARVGLASKDRQITTLGTEIGELRLQLAHLGREIEETKSRTAHPSSLMSQIIQAEIGPLIAAAQDAAQRIVNDAQTSMNEQLARADMAQSDLKAQVQDIAAWHQRVGPLIESVRARMAETRSRIDEVPDRLSQALAPLAELVGSMGDQLEALMASSTPPALATDIADKVAERWQHPTEAPGITLPEPTKDEEKIVLDTRVDLEFADSW